LLEVLYTQADVSREVKKLFGSTENRRVAISAFVGDGADALLPRPRGIHLVCWPKPGGTNPGMLRELWKNGVRIEFSNRLHMKVYWAENGAAIITSANLSSNALGQQNLKEVGIKIDSDLIDIDKILRSLSARPITKSALRALEVAHRRYWKNNRGTVKRDKAITFKDWMGPPAGEEWKLLAWNEESKVSKAVTERLKLEYPTRKKTEDSFDAKPGWYEEDDWVLSFRYAGKKVTEIMWRYIDWLVKVNPHAPGYPLDIVQVWPSDHYPQPPFKIDPKFRKAFISVVAALERKDVWDLEGQKPSEGMLSRILEKYERF